MKLINLTQKVIITTNLKIANTLIQSTVGLLNQSKGTTMLFKTRWGIHTFGMKYPIDILVLNNEMRIISIKKNLLPNRFFLWNPKYSTIIELQIKNLNININDHLQIKTQSLHSSKKQSTLFSINK